MITADGFAPLTTALYPEGDEYLHSDAVFGVKKSLVIVRLLSLIRLMPSWTVFQKLGDISEAEAKTRGFKAGADGKHVEFDFIMSTVEENEHARSRNAQA
jgi:hypothetical protein